MSGELKVKESPQDMSTGEVINWQCYFGNTFTPAPTSGSVFCHLVTNGEPGTDVSSTILASSGAASLTGGTITADAMYGSAGAAGQVYRISFVGSQGGQRCTQWLYINMKA